MLETIGVLGGALVRLISFFAEYKQKQQDNQHELDMIDKQMELSKVQAEQKKEEIQLQGEVNIDVEWAKALPTALEAPKTGIPFIDGLNAAIRPVLTLWWCLGLYTIYKGFIIYAAATAHTPAGYMASIIVTEFDLTIVGSIIGFWFVDRHLRKLSGN